MRHSAWKPVLWLSLFAVATACNDNNDNGSGENPSSSESGTSGSTTAGRSSTTTAGRSSTTTTAGRGGSTSTSTLAGRSGTTTTSTAGAGGNSANAGRGTTPAAGRGGSTATASNAGRGGTGGSAGATEQAYSDAEIAAILTAANNGEVQQGNVAVTKAVSPSVRSYAQDLVDMHTAAQTRLNAVITAESLTPAESATSMDLTRKSSQIVAKLQGASLDAFDMMYIQDQIDVHREVLTLIDEQLLPNAKNNAVRTELKATREAVVTHLNRGRAIATTLDLSVDAGAEADAGY